MEGQKKDCLKSENCCCEENKPETKENTMNSSMRDKAEGKLHEVKGAIKEAAGKLSDNPKLQIEGAVEKTAGRIQEKVGQVKQVFGK